MQISEPSTLSAQYCKLAVLQYADQDTVEVFGTHQGLSTPEKTAYPLVAQAIEKTMFIT
jgi:hypothetical protein